MRSRCSGAPETPSARYNLGFTFRPDFLTGRSFGSLDHAVDPHRGEQLPGDALRCCLTVNRQNADAGRGLRVTNR